MASAAVQSASSSGPARHSPMPSSSHTPRIDPLLDDEPPPYTPSPNALAGESSLEFGPHRAFQPAPPPGQRPTPAPRPWSEYPGARGAHGFASQLSAELARSPLMSDLTRASSQIVTRVGSQVAHRTRGTPLETLFSPIVSPQPGGRSPAPPPDDGRPTSSPVPGHPLLRDGELLVYPQGYECPKCYNTGYSHLRVDHPCRKCWQRFAQLYLPHLPLPPGAQRPLPARSASPAMPGAFPTRHASLASRARPPAGSTVLRPGDPRIGGRLCWRCGGCGTVSVFIFDEETCDTCQGIGRIGV